MREREGWSYAERVREEGRGMEGERGERGKGERKPGSVASQNQP